MEVFSKPLKQFVLLGGWSVLAFYALQSWSVLSHSLSCDVHQSLLFNTDTKITKFRHQVVSIRISFLSVLYRWIHIQIFWFMRLAQLGHQRRTQSHKTESPIVNYIWKCDLFSPFSLCLSFTRATGFRTNTSLNQQYSTVVVILKQFEANVFH